MVYTLNRRPGTPAMAFRSPRRYGMQSQLWTSVITWRHHVKRSSHRLSSLSYGTAAPAYNHKLGDPEKRWVLTSAYSRSPVLVQSN